MDQYYHGSSLYGPLYLYSEGLRSGEMEGTVSGVKVAVVSYFIGLVILKKVIYFALYHIL